MPDKKYRYAMDYAYYSNEDNSGYWRLRSTTPSGSHSGDAA